MPETVLVTIRWNGNESDFELPSFTPAGTWLSNLCETARLVFSGLQFQGKEVRILYDGKSLSPEDTLEQCGIYDGSTLELQVM